MFHPQKSANFLFSLPPSNNCAILNEIIDKGHKFGLFVKIQFLESKSRKILFEIYPPKYIYVYSERQQCSMNGDFENLKAKTQAYIWVIWEKDYKGETITRWI